MLLSIVSQRRQVQTLYRLAAVCRESLTTPPTGNNRFDYHLREVNIHGAVGAIEE